MWWSDRIAIAGLLLGLLAACGFEPVYQTGGALEQRLSQVHVVPQASRIGFATRNALLNAIQAPDHPVRPAYRLELTVTGDRERLGIEADETASRIHVVLQTSWTLKQLGEDSKVIDRGNVRRIVPYNVVDDDYASLIAERDAEELAGRMTGEAIRTRLLLLFRER